MEPMPLIHGFRIVPGRCINTESCRAHHPHGELVLPILWVVMVVLDFLNVLDLVDGVRHSVGFRVQNHLEFGESLQDSRWVNSLGHIALNIFN